MNRPKLPKLAPVAPDNTVLRDLLEQGRVSPEDARLSLLSALQTTMLFVPILTPGKGSGATRQANLQIAVLENPNGQYLTAFTDESAYRQFAPVQQLQYAGIAAVDLCRFARQGGFQAVVLNAGGPVSYALSPIEYQMVAERLLPSEDNVSLSIQRNTVATIGMPDQRPDEATLNAMRAIVQQEGAQESYWFWLQFQDGIPHLGLAVTPEEPERIVAMGKALTPVWKAARPDNPLLDILPLNNDELGETIREKGERLL